MKQMILNFNIKRILLVVLVLLLFSTKVLAINSETLTGGVCLKYDGSSVVNDNDCLQINYLSSSDSAFIRSDSLGIVNGELTCTHDSSWSDDKIGVAYIINTITGSTGGKTSLSSNYSTYYWLNVALYAYLNPTLPDGYSRTKLNSDYPDIISKARTYQNTYSKNISLSLSSDSLEFTKNDDGTYSSQKVYITDENNNASVNVTLNNNNFELSEGIENEKKYFIVTTKANVNLNSRISVTATIKGNNSYYVAERYNCSNGQYLVSSTTSKVNLDEKRLSISGVVTATEISIDLKNTDGSYLGGATFKVENQDKTYSEVFTTSNSALKIYGLSYGRYTITQLGAPSTYVRFTGEEVVDLTEENLQGTISVVNQKTKVRISNKSKDGLFIAGSKLKIEDQYGNVIYNIKSENDYNIIEGIPQGTYYLKQVEAPNRYKLNSKPVKFVIDYDTAIIDVNIENDITFDVPNTMSSKSALLLSISMIVVAIGLGILINAKNSYEV